MGPGVSTFQSGEAVFGVTNAQFTGAYAEYALADAAIIAPKPRRLSDGEAASVPVVASTAWQMVFDPCVGSVSANGGRTSTMTRRNVPLPGHLQAVHQLERT